MTNCFQPIQNCLPSTPLILAYFALSVLSSQYFIYHEHQLPSYTKEGRIFDLGHHWLPDLGRLEQVFDLVPLIPLGYFVLRGGWKEWKPFMWIFSFIFLLRSLTAAVTILPPCDREKDTIRTRMQNMLALGGSHDYIFSGHTALMLLSVVFLLNQQGGKGSLFWWAYAVVSSVFIVASGNHYTVDVVLSWAITLLTYSFFTRGCPP